jgi:hypothetical protein
MNIRMAEAMRTQARHRPRRQILRWDPFKPFFVS